MHPLLGSQNTSQNISSNSSAVLRCNTSCLILVFLIAYLGFASIFLLYPVLDSLHLSFLTLQWFFLAYFVSAAGFTAFFGQTGFVLPGRFMPYLIGIVVLGTGSLLLSISYDIGTLFVGRILQGLGVALATPGSLTVMQSCATDQTRHKSNRLWTAFLLLGVCISCPIATLSAFATWHLAYWITLPLFMIAFLLVAPYCTHSKPSRRIRDLDFTGVILCMSAIVLIVLLFSTGSSWGWTSPTLITFYATATITLIAFLLQQTKSRYPLLVYALCNDRTFLVGLACIAINYWVLFAYGYIYVLYSQSILATGYSYFRSAIYFLPFPAAIFVMTYFNNRLQKYIQPALLMIIGTLITTAAFLAMVWLYPATSYASTWWAITLAGIGYGICYPHTSQLAAAELPKKQQPYASSYIATLIYLSGAIGAAIAAIIYNASAVASLLKHYQQLGLSSAISQSISKRLYQSPHHLIQWQQWLHSYSIPTQQQIKQIANKATGHAFSYTCLLFAGLFFIECLLLIWLFADRKKTTTTRADKKAI